MADYLVTKGRTSLIITIFIQDSSSTTGAGLTGLTSGSSGLVCYRARADDGNAGGTAISLSAGTLGTYSSGGFVKKDDTNMPGWYEFGVPTAAVAAGSDYCALMFKGATNMVPLPVLIQLANLDIVDGVRAGLTAIPNVASGSAGALLVDGTGTAAISNSSGKVLLQATQSGVTIPTVTTVTNQLSAAQIATGVWQDASGSDFTAASSIGKSLYTTGNAPGAASGLALVGSNMGSVTSVSGSVNSVTGAVGSVTQRVTANTDQLAGQTVTAGAGVTFPSSVASPTNITAATGVDITKILGTAISAPATAGILDVNVKNMNNVAGTAITTIKAVQGLAVDGVITTATNLTTNNDKTGYALTSSYDFSKGTVAMTESYAANGVAPTPAQAMMAIHQMLMQFGISGTNVTVKKLDNSTTAFVVTLDSSTTPTSAVRT